MLAAMSISYICYLKECTFKTDKVAVSL